MITIQKGGEFTGTFNLSDVLRGLAQNQAIIHLKDTEVPTLTNSTGMVADYRDLYLPAKLVAVQTNGAETGASAADVEAGFTAIITGLSVVLAAASVFTDALGYPGLLDNSGAYEEGAVEVPAIFTDLDGSATGPTAEAFNTVLKSVNSFAATVYGRVRFVAGAVGEADGKGLPVLRGLGDSFNATVPALGVDVGDEGQNTVKATDVSTAFASYAILLSTLTDILNAAAEQAESGKLKVVAG